ncbi:unnamed protein product, partial [Mesorhabditis belari]|uniref:K Homology domain-containing protein n=1 Tax=Mesorhabditis belari TaxID=2138241 RepID=A0AAF3J1Y4_9BILA
MDYYQSRQAQQYPVSSTSTTAQSQAAPSNYMYASNNMYYAQPSTGLQQYAPQHFQAGMAGSQNHTQPAATHSSHWNNDYAGVTQQNPTQNQQSRRPPQHQQPSAAYGTYRPAGQVQPDASNSAAAIGLARPGHAQMMATQGPPQLPQQDLPLRMVVEAKFVGAIIGQGGGNIREISKESKARCVVDVARAMRDQDGTIEKVISILGQPENCTKACVKILEVIQRELEKEDQDKTQPEVTLKLRAHNQLVGRLIGKQGSTIKKIMQDTNSTIFVSNEPASQMSAAFPPMLDILQQERTITVRAPTIQEISNAEQKISSKLRQSFEMDIANRMQQFPGGYHMGMPGIPSVVNPIGDAYAMVGMNMRNPLMANTPKTVRMFVPNNMVGAIIGTKGANIRNIMRNSGAQIKIEGGERKREGDIEEQEREKEREREEREKNPEEERMVTIIGNDSQQYRAQFWIYQRVAEQTNHSLEEVRLRTEVQVPAKLVGRIIGKGGQNVRELQRVTGAQVKIPDDTEEAGESEGGSAPKKDVSTISDEDMSSLRIVGTFQSAQSVQLRIAHVCADFARSALNNERRERLNKDTRSDNEDGDGQDPISQGSPE